MSFEKVNPSHPDKVADRIAGAIVDLAYKKQDNPKIAVEVLIGHGNCHIITETSVHLEDMDVLSIVNRIMFGTTDIEELAIDYKEVPQDSELAKNQAEGVRCGDNGIFKGVPRNPEEVALSKAVRELYDQFPTDGKFIYDEETKTFIVCQSNASDRELLAAIDEIYYLDHSERLMINPLGEWTGGTNVDTGATNRKLGSDMGRAVTGGGLHGKDLSKADVSVNIACQMMAEATGKEVQALCAIGDDEVEFRIKGEPNQCYKYWAVVENAKRYINKLGGFEKLAEWGLI